MDYIMAQGRLKISHRA
ncbi:unnamed protein product, partial [Rotaria sp. Silwood1]